MTIVFHDHDAFVHVVEQHVSDEQAKLIARMRSSDTTWRIDAGVGESVTVTVSSSDPEVLATIEKAAREAGLELIRE